MAGPVGLEDDLRHLAIIGPAGGGALRALRRSAVEQYHVGMPLAHLVESVPDAEVIVALDAAGKGDARAGGQKRLNLGPALSV